MRPEDSSPIANLRTVEFRLSLRGYDVGAVDTYLEDLAVALEGGEFASPTPTPEDVQSQTFRLSRRGYSTSEVDAYLEAVAEELTSRPNP